MGWWVSHCTGACLAPGKIPSKDLESCVRSKLSEDSRSGRLTCGTCSVFSSACERCGSALQRCHHRGRLGRYVADIPAQIFWYTLRRVTTAFSTDKYKYKISWVGHSTRRYGVRGWAKFYFLTGSAGYFYVEVMFWELIFLWVVLRRVEAFIQWESGENASSCTEPEDGFRLMDCSKGKTEWMGNNSEEVKIKLEHEEPEEMLLNIWIKICSTNALHFSFFLGGDILANVCAFCV